MSAHRSPDPPRVLVVGQTRRVRQGPGIEQVDDHDVGDRLAELTGQVESWFDALSEEEEGELRAEMI